MLKIVEETVNFYDLEKCIFCDFGLVDGTYSYLENDHEKKCPRCINVMYDTTQMYFEINDYEYILANTGHLYRSKMGADQGFKFVFKINEVNKNIIYNKIKLLDELL
ncbi:MAG: hypothetical protein LC122_12120 [Chitinophagales bacterium]|nr:hypothetical protein [Chitinophagales bacterium]